MSIKFGSRPVEFEKDKAGIMVQTKDKVALGNYESDEQSEPAHQNATDNIVR
jgi:hypothetical protein